jgi:hypothetical protein
MAGSPDSDENATAQELGDPLTPTAWPPPRAHCGQPLSQSTDEWITIAEVTSEPANGYKGNRLLFTALIPKADLSGVLGSVGGIHNNVSLAGFQRVFGPDGQMTKAFPQFRDFRHSVMLKILKSRSGASRVAACRSSG